MKTMELNKIYNGDALSTLKTFPNECVDCVITSPPYYALRDYGIDGQLGLEKTFHEYLDKLIEIFAEVKRVLKPTGTVWVNLGDSYGGSNQGYGDKGNRDTGFQDVNKGYYASSKDKCALAKIMPKSLLNIPSRFAIRMTDELGFIQRNEIIWYKRNCMPSSAKDRFTVDFEKVYFFTKNKKYYFEQVFEKYADVTLKDRETDHYSYNGKDLKDYNKNKVQRPLEVKQRILETMQQKGGRNKRCVWDITTKPYKESHFAVFPEDLVKPMIQAGCPEFVCTKCGKIKEKVTVKEFGKGEGKPYNANRPDGMIMNGRNRKSKIIDEYYIQCTCNADFTGGIVLDLFAGSGTTLKVAKDMNRNYIGIELNPNYIPLIEKRLDLHKLKLAI